MSAKKCCVPNCNMTREDTTILHTFPNPEKNLDRFQLWIDAIGGDVVNLDNKIVFECRRICHSHFEPKFYTRSKRLSPAAVPTLFLLGTKSQQPLGDLSNQANRDDILFIPNTVPTLQHASTSCKQPIETEGNVLVEHNYFKKKDVNNILEPTYFKDTEETVVPEPEKYSWQKNEAVSIADPIDTEEFADENSLYNDDRAPTPILEVDVDDSPLHVGFQCNACNGEIKGFRYTCVQCEDFDLCSACELNGAHAQHYMLRVPKPKPYMETQIVLERIRRHLMKKLDPIEGDQEPEDDTSLKLEIKSEVDEEEELGKDMEIEDIGDTTTSDQDESIILRADENTPDTSIREPEERNITNDSTSRQMDTVPSTAKRKIIVPHTDIQLQDDPPAKRNLVPVKRIEFRKNVTRKEVYLENCVLLKPGTSLNSECINPRSEKCRKWFVFFY